MTENEASDPANPMAKIFQNLGNQSPSKKLSPEEKAKRNKGCLTMIGLWFIIGLIIRIIVSIVSDGEEEDAQRNIDEEFTEVQAALIKENSNSSFSSNLADFMLLPREEQMFNRLPELDLPELNRFPTSMFKDFYKGFYSQLAVDLGLEWNANLGFDIFTREEYACIGESLLSKSTSHVDMSNWFFGMPLEPQIENTMYETSYECGELRKLLALSLLTINNNPDRAEFTAEEDGKIYISPVKNPDAVSCLVEVWSGLKAVEPRMSGETLSEEITLAWYLDESSVELNWTSLGNQVALCNLLNPW